MHTEMLALGLISLQVSRDFPLRPPRVCLSLVSRAVIRIIHGRTWQVSAHATKMRVRHAHDRCTAPAPTIVATVSWQSVAECTAVTPIGVVCTSANRTRTLQGHTKGVASRPTSLSVDLFTCTALHCIALMQITWSFLHARVCHGCVLAPCARCAVA